MDHVRSGDTRNASSHCAPPGRASATSSSARASGCKCVRASPRTAATVAGRRHGADLGLCEHLFVWDPDPLTRWTARSNPIPLYVALRRLPLISRASPTEYNAWALRWLARWCAEAPAPSIEQAAEVTASLADLASESVEAFDALRQAC